MPRRHTVRIKYQVQVTQRVTRQVRLRPTEYLHLSAGRVERFVCSLCNNTIEQWDTAGSAPQMCPYCGHQLGTES